MFDIENLSPIIAFLTSSFTLSISVLVASDNLSFLEDILLSIQASSSVSFILYKLYLFSKGPVDDIFLPSSKNMKE